MQAVTTIGLDIAKPVFQVHGVDCNGQVVIRRQLKRRYVLAFFEKLAPCLIGIEACASSHHWSRQLQALGHDVRLMPPEKLSLGNISLSQPPAFKTSSRRSRGSRSSFTIPIRRFRRRENCRRDSPRKPDLRHCRH
jgi:hypothetical protein